MKLKILLKRQIYKTQFSRFVLKPKLRKKILKIREKNNTKDIKINFDKIIKLIKKEKITKKVVGGYYPVNFEVNDLELLKKLEKNKFDISLPVIKKNFQMDFYKWSFSDPLKVNKYGIPEPKTKNIVYPDILLIPLVAFDKNLNRLGYGAGYYDRLITKLSKKKKIMKIGLALSVQKINEVPINKYDKRLDYIVTNKYILK
jgi:5-formyltetrahydrofolate cyclo-ligase